MTAKRLHDGGRAAVAAFVAGATCLATGALAALIGIMATDNAMAPPALAGPALAKSEPAANRYGLVEAAPLTLRQVPREDYG